MFKVFTTCEGCHFVNESSDHQIFIKLQIMQTSAKVDLSNLIEESMKAEVSSSMAIHPLLLPEKLL